MPPAQPQMPMMGQPMPGQPMMMAPAAHSSKPTIAAVFCILGMLVSIIGIIAVVILASIAGSFGMLGMFGGSIAIVGALGALGFIGGLMGAMFCFKRQNWNMALIGTILLIVSTHFITGIIALIFVALSKNEFAS